MRSSRSITRQDAPELREKLDDGTVISWRMEDHAGGALASAVALARETPGRVVTLVAVTFRAGRPHWPALAGRGHGKHPRGRVVARLRFGVIADTPMEKGELRALFGTVRQLGEGRTRVGNVWRSPSVDLLGHASHELAAADASDARVAGEAAVRLFEAARKAARGRTIHVFLPLARASRPRRRT